MSELQYQKAGLYQEMHMTGRCGFPKPLSILSFFLVITFCIIAGCLHESISGSRQTTSGNDMMNNNQSDEAIAIALADKEVRAFLQDGYTLKNVGPLCYEKAPGDGNVYEACFTGVEFETKNVYLVAYVDLNKHRVNSTSTMYIRKPIVPPTGTTFPVTTILSEPIQPAFTDLPATKTIPDLIVNYSEIAYIGIQDPSDPVDENRKNVVAEAAVADDRVRAILLDGGMIEGVLLQCHPTAKDSGGSACALALRVLYEGSNWDFLVDEKSGVVIFVQREVLPGRI